MLEDLKEEVLLANLELVKQGLVKYTWGNVSAFDEKSSLIVIKPSGLPYEVMKAKDMVVLDLEGRVVEGKLRPSSDTPTHIELYKNFKDIRGLTHSHSMYATIFAQAGLHVEALGTTHADTFYGSVPCARFLTEAEVNSNYEQKTGELIVSLFKEKNLKPLEVPGVLLHGHGPFSWGKSASSAVEHAVILEEVCKMNYHTLMLNQKALLPNYILEKHYQRKHGKGSYYGQKQ